MTKPYSIINLGKFYREKRILKIRQKFVKQAASFAKLRRSGMLKEKTSRLNLFPDKCSSS